MPKDVKLTKDQERRIKATLKRIRCGLRRSQRDQFDEPAHLFAPELINAKQE